MDKGKKVKQTAVLCCLIVLARFSNIAGQSTLIPVASYRGTHGWERVGYCLADIGDVNNDGYDDFGIGNFHTNRTGAPATYNAGSVYIIFGKASGLQYNVSLTNADARIVGKYGYDALGYSVSSRGDINGDGIEDLLIGAAAGGIAGNPGHVYIVFGENNANWGNNFIANDYADASFDGENSVDLAGISVDIIGDINGDGYDEFIMGAPNNDGESNTYDNNYGKSYLFFGKPTGWQRNTPVTQADAIFWGYIQNGFSGYTVEGLGDVNGDGILDIGIGARGAGRIYLIFGRQEMDWGKNFSLMNADVIFNAEEPSYVGWQIAHAGDVNGDGYDDFLIGAPFYSTPDFRRGKAYLILGKSTEGWVDISLSYADASFIGEYERDQAGYGVAGNFDFNHDGLSDILIGAKNNDENGDDSGKAYLIKGKKTGWSRNVALSTVNDYFFGQHVQDYAGFAVSSAGDFNADGIDDFVTSATYNHEVFEKGGEIYLFFGASVSKEISGSITYHSNDVSVPNISLKVNDIEGEAYTNQSGQYLLEFLTEPEYIIIPTKPKGEDVGDIAISAYDAALIARHTMRLNTLNPDQFNLADVDQDGKITIFDAVLIARYSVELPDLDGSHVGEWFFSPQNRHYVDFSVSMSDQMYTAYIHGDVDGNWNGPSLPKQNEISVNNMDYRSKSLDIKGDTVIVSFSTDGECDLLSFDVKVEYDKQDFKFLNIEKDALISEFDLFSNVKDSVIQLCAFGVNAIHQAGELFSLKFLINQNYNNQSKLEIKYFYINNQLIQENVLLTGVNNSSEVVKPEFEIYFNYPNPFNNHTTFQYYIPNDDHTEIVIYNQMGNRIKTLLDEKQMHGYHRLTWDGTNDNNSTVSSGIYFITLMYNNMFKNMKILLLK
jgi:hypothetical protein